MAQLITKQGKLIAFNRLWKPTPDYTAPTLFKVGEGTTPPIDTDTDLESPVDITTGVQTKVYLSGYPLKDETNLQATIRTNLLITEANGTDLSEFGLFNADGTKKCFSRSIFTPLAKNTSVQCVFIEKDKII
jgi:hypothetical protein